MGRSVYADQHSYEVMREFAHQKRKKINHLLKEMVVPLEKQLLEEYGIAVSEGANGPEIVHTSKKVRSQK